MEVRTNKRRWCVLKDQHLYIFKTQEEPALFQIALPGCDISTVPKNDKTKVRVLEKRICKRKNYCSYDMSPTNRETHERYTSDRIGGLESDNR